MPNLRHSVPCVDLHLAPLTVYTDIKRNGLLYWAGAFGLDELDASDAFRKIPNDADILVRILRAAIPPHKTQLTVANSH